MDTRSISEVALVIKEEDEEEAERRRDFAWDQGALNAKRPKRTVESSLVTFFSKSRAAVLSHLIARYVLSLSLACHAFFLEYFLKVCSSSFF